MNLHPKWSRTHKLIKKWGSYRRGDQQKNNIGIHILQFMKLVYIISILTECCTYPPCMVDPWGLWHSCDLQQLLLLVRLVTPGTDCSSHQSLDFRTFRRSHPSIKISLIKLWLSKTNSETPKLRQVFLAKRSSRSPNPPMVHQAFSGLEVCASFFCKASCNWCRTLVPCSLSQKNFGSWSIVIAGIAGIAGWVQYMSSPKKYAKYMLTHHIFVCQWLIYPSIPRDDHK